MLRLFDELCARTQSAEGGEGGGRTRKAVRPPDSRSGVFTRSTTSPRRGAGMFAKTSPAPRHLLSCRAFLQCSLRRQHLRDAAKERSNALSLPTRKFVHIHPHRHMELHGAFGGLSECGCDHGLSSLGHRSRILRGVCACFRLQRYTLSCDRHIGRSHLASIPHYKPCGGYIVEQQRQLRLVVRLCTTRLGKIIDRFVLGHCSERELRHQSLRKPRSGNNRGQLLCRGFRLPLVLALEIYHSVGREESLVG